MLNTILNACIAAIAFFACSCTSTDKIKILLSTEDFNLSFNEELVGDLVHWRCFGARDETFLGSYDYLLHKIIIFNLETQKLAYTIPLMKEGPNKINLSSLHFISPDSIVLYDQKNLHLVNLKGEIVKKFSLEQKGMPRIQSTSHLAHKNKTLFLPSKSAEIIERNGVFFSEAITKLDLESGAFVPLEVLVPPEYEQKKDYSGKLRPNITLLPNANILYNFPLSADIYLYDTSTGLCSRIDCSSDYSPAISPARTAETSGPFEYIFQLFYKGFYYDLKNERYYGIHYGNLKPNGELYASPPHTFLRIYDTSFNKLGEYHLSNAFKPQPMYNQNTVYLPVNIPDKEYRSELVKIEIGQVANK